MKKVLQAVENQKVQQESKLAATTRGEECCKDKAALSDSDLEQVSAAGDVVVPTMNPEVLLGRHDIPADTGKRNP